MDIRTLTTALCLIAAPALAQDASPDSGADLMGEALRLFMQGLIQEIEPALDGMEGLLDNLDAYHPPEVLPNGDIIIRRKRPDEALPDGETEI